MEKSGTIVPTVGLDVAGRKLIKWSSIRKDSVIINIKLQGTSKGTTQVTWPHTTSVTDRIFSLAKNDNYAIT